MNPKAVPQADVKSRFRLFSLCLSLAMVGLMSFVLAGSAIAAPAVGKDGKVHACYRVKGKAKGSMRVVPANKKCRHGERKLSWDISGSAGSTGQAGSGGAAGTNGSTGTAGPQGSSNEAALQAKSPV